MLSPIKFQADMGLLLAFMFLWNMLGALILLPALAHFLLRPSDIAAAPDSQQPEQSCAAKGEVDHGQLSHNLKIPV
ncbi:hypothetical protein D3C87_1970930 [compost metagenome]